MGESLFEPLRQRGVQILLVNMAQEAPAEHMAMLARAFDIQAVGFPAQAEVFELGAAKVGCVAGQWVRSFAASRALALAGAEILLFFDAPQDLPILRARAMENRVFVMAVSERGAVIIGPDGVILGQTAEANLAEVCAEIDLNDARDKLVAPKTDLFAERRPALYRF
jgi:predicted amidohydrolase